MKLILSKEKLELSPFSTESLFLLLYFDIFEFLRRYTMRRIDSVRRFHFDRVILR